MNFLLVKITEPESLRRANSSLVNLASHQSTPIEQETYQDEKKRSSSSVVPSKTVLPSGISGG